MKKLYTEEMVIELLKDQRKECLKQWGKVDDPDEKEAILNAPSPPLPEGIEVLSDKLYKEIESSIAGMCHDDSATARATDKVIKILSKLTGK